MLHAVKLSGVQGSSFRESLFRLLSSGHPQVFGIAAAFVSVHGVRQLSDILRRCGSPQCRLIAGVDNAVTHPEALYAARENGWMLRIGRASGAGIFHPKLIVAGDRFSNDGSVRRLRSFYVGSSNLTGAGLNSNVECGLFATGEACDPTASAAFATLWRGSNRATTQVLRDYAARFAEISRTRRISELLSLGVLDAETLPPAGSDLRDRRPPSRPAVAATFAVAAWAGLESFTGEYRFQLEFPKDAGLVISQLIGSRATADGHVDVYCPADGTTRSMQYRFYVQNSMFRLNVHNDVPGVALARQRRSGIALVEKGPPGGAPLRITFLEQGMGAKEVVDRSVSLGTWGRTTTRVYGWY